MRAPASGLPAPPGASGGACSAAAGSPGASTVTSAAAAAPPAPRSRTAVLRRGVGEFGVTVVLCWFNGRGHLPAGLGGPAGFRGRTKGLLRTYIPLPGIP
ncbi:hypothetical protein GCM10023224_31910 [Streptomonospora halophila]|uniref:Uncharacterized protein n=1 Tax=Streptomonospora halophila TaxID=427369 RepID=A0ABP9GK12_9ACTN